MGNKPRFWDFYRAYKYSKIKDDILYIYEKDRGKLVQYLKPPYKKRKQWKTVMVVAALVLYLLWAVPWLISIGRILFFFNLNLDLLAFFTFVPRPLTTIIVCKYIHSYGKFEKVSEIEWDKDKEKPYLETRAPYRVVSFFLAILYIVAILFIGFTPVYIRYLADRALGTPWEARVQIKNTLDSNILLDDETLPGKDFIIENRNGARRTIVISTYRIPELVKMYLNGKEIELDYSGVNSGYAGQFWSDDYFRLVNVDNIYLNIPEGENTLELKSANFSKSWTFNVEYAGA